MVYTLIAPVLTVCFSLWGGVSEKKGLQRA
jgi:hypothetical protein